MRICNHPAKRTAKRRLRCVKAKPFIQHAVSSKLHPYRERRRRVPVTISAARLAYAAGSLSLLMLSLGCGGVGVSRRIVARTATAAGSSIRSGSPCSVRDCRASSAPACRMAARSSALIVAGGRWSSVVWPHPFRDHGPWLSTFTSTARLRPYARRRARGRGRMSGHWTSPRGRRGLRGDRLVPGCPGVRPSPGRTARHAPRVVCMARPARACSRSR